MNEKRKAYMREYMKRRYAEDPEFRKRANAAKLRSSRRLRQDPAYREREKDAKRNAYARFSSRPDWWLARTGRSMSEARLKSHNPVMDKWTKWQELPYDVLVKMNDLDHRSYCAWWLHAHPIDLKVGSEVVAKLEAYARKGA